MLRQALAAQGKTVFHHLEKLMSSHRDSPAHSLGELRERANTHVVGRAFEQLVWRWLPFRPGVTRAWGLQDVPDRGSLNLTAADMGIDGVAQHTDGTHSAIQVKFRSRSGAIAWRDIATFYALAARTGPRRW